MCSGLGTGPPSAQGALHTEEGWGDPVSPRGGTRGSERARDLATPHGQLGSRSTPGPGCPVTHAWTLLPVPHPVPSGSPQGRVWFWGESKWGRQMRKEQALLLALPPPALAHAHAHAHARAHTHVHAHTCTHVPTKHTHAHTCVHKCTHVHTRTCSARSPQPTRGPCRCSPAAEPWAAGRRAWPAVRGSTGHRNPDLCLQPVWLEARDAALTLLAASLT